MDTAAANRTAAPRAVTVAWLALAAITVLSWWLAPAHSHGPVTSSVPITLAVAALAVIKSRLIIRYFMEVRHAPRWLQLSTDAWLLVLWAAILAVYLW
ncbi:cytochrome C oxidase subunit IV family protein [Mycolicibacterium litorale]|uniref:Prokaryotic cytochrome C oxidase subunit IV family protein n=1 Tax=Mycolicibacterium litorale TaxID=758802 RepID=A0AAD1MQD7_9MYCO|nr:cytochrome C oxidase subunit IV family protein [Mycolicibacterium litorale]MCV7413911.1 cytochrome C oxidase subunit IV family protein [Mycolicibacterium litorale]TDY03205.1 cytochrome c oxidase subunit IV [Mycolicibacterium litorale]BBY14999.1 prokaryotic cytochrome C oxidase subunit IV family protein [Mycolicibacterium litorale]